MIRIENPAQCCGCGNCINICPEKCIEMVEDGAGFRFPFVKETDCIHCKKCERVCPTLNHQNEEDKNHQAYVAYAKNERLRFEGSSGGMFGSIATNLFDIKGQGNVVVYGAAFDENLRLRCTSADNGEKLRSLFKSKYLQSDLENVFFEIKSFLEKGMYVLFTSTPCQVCALKLFLGKNYENLLTVDFICHGVPSQNFFDKCRNYVEKKENIKILSYQFRAKKSKGATPHYYKVCYKKKGKIKEKVRLYTKDPFYLGFQKYLTLRDSCYHCQFCYSNRCSDITISDFHEVDKYVKGINRFDGVSLFVVNTDKGNSVWQSIKPELVYYLMNFDELVKKEKFMAGGTTEPTMRSAFIEDLENRDFEFVVNKYLNPKAEWKKDIYYNLPKSLRETLKKLMRM